MWNACWKFVATALTLTASACESTPRKPADAALDASPEASDDASEPDSGGGDTLGPTGLPRVHTADPAAAEHGARVLTTEWPGKGVVPQLALRHLYLAWSEDLGALYLYYSDVAKYWAAFSERYGLAIDDGLPVGFVDSGDGQVSMTCLACHAGVTPQGLVAIGLANSRFDLQGLYDDLMALPAAFEALKQRDLPEPYKSLVAQIPVPPAPPPLLAMSARTGAAGATDAMGLGLAFAALSAGRTDIEGRMGYTQAPAWWQTAFKQRRYTDGSGRFGGHRSMMSTLMGLGMSVGEIAAFDQDFVDVEQYLASLEPPRWPFEPPDAAQVASGRVTFVQACASCHGTYEGDDRAYFDRIVPLAEIGTDPVRVESFGEAEVALFNELMQDPVNPLERTGGYLAPPLVGVWATAPYLHNASVPDLAGVLDSRERPARWRRTGDGPEHYDTARVGWRFEVPAEPLPEGAPPATIEARRSYETSQPGLSNAGHAMGDALTADEREALIAYMKTL